MNFFAVCPKALKNYSEPNGIASTTDGGILVFWELWQNHVVNSEEMKWKKIEFKCEAEECQEQIFANNGI